MFVWRTSAPRAVVCNGRDIIETIITSELSRLDWGHGHEAHYTRHRASHVVFQLVRRLHQRHSVYPPRVVAPLTSTPGLSSGESAAEKDFKPGLVIIVMYNSALVLVHPLDDLSELYRGYHTVFFKMSQNLFFGTLVNAFSRSRNANYTAMLYSRVFSRIILRAKMISMVLLFSLYTCCNSLSSSTCLRRFFRILT